MDKVLNEIRCIALNYKNINKVVLFGSRARGDNTDKSDYDIAVFSNGMEHIDECRFKDDIDEMRTLSKVDIIFIEDRHIGTEIYKNIMNDGVVIMDKFQIKLDNYKRALARLHEAIDEEQATQSLAVRDGAIKRFEFTAELAWKTIREYLLSIKVANINSPKNVMREAFSQDIINDDVNWIQILDDRNTTAHIYDEDDSNKVYNRIATTHIKLFDELESTLTKITIE